MKHTDLKPNMRVKYKQEGTWGSYDAMVLRVGQNRVTIVIDGWMGEPREKRQVTVTARCLTPDTDSQ